MTSTLWLEEPSACKLLHDSFAASVHILLLRSDTEFATATAILASKIA
jgi:hypothetical protein